MKKQNIMPTVVLAAICVVVAVLLGVVNMLTSPVISERNEKAISESLAKVMEGGQFNSEPDVLKEGAPSTVSKVYTEKTGKGTVVVLLTNKGYTGKYIGITVGIDTDGKITGMQITQNEESIVPSNMKPGGSYGDSYIGAEADDITDLVTGATVSYTEAAIKKAINDAFVYLGFAEEGEKIPRTDAEIAQLVKAFYGSDATLEATIPEDTEYVKRIYKEAGKSSYVAYACSYSQYGTPDFEFLVHVDENGTVKAINKLLWKVSDAVPEWGYNPPSEERVEEFFNSFVGLNASTVPSVDVSTGATNTASKVRDAALEALKFFKPRIPREISEIEALAKALYGKSSAKLECIELEGYDYAGLAFKEKGSDSYVIYSFNYSRYGTPEFEFLVYVENGAVKAIDKILWKVSDAVPEWGYNPPSEERVEEFFNSFVGKDAATVPSVDVSTGATNTASGVRDAVLETLKVTFDKEVNYAPRVIGIVVLVLAAASFAAVTIISKKARGVKK